MVLNASRHEEDACTCTNLAISCKCPTVERTMSRALSAKNQAFLGEIHSWAWWWWWWWQLGLAKKYCHVEAVYIFWMPRAWLDWMYVPWDFVLKKLDQVFTVAPNWDSYDYYNSYYLRNRLRSQSKELILKSCTTWIQATNKLAKLLSNYSICALLLP